MENHITVLGIHLAVRTFEIIAPLVVLAAASPGPDVIYIVSNALSGKWKSALSAWSGICLGIIGYGISSALGLAALFAAFPAMYYVIKWLGVFYLAYIGFCFLRAAKSGQSVIFRAADEDVRPVRLFTKGLMVNILNPKTTMFFTAFLPQFVDPSAGSIPLQLLILGLFSIAIGQSVYVCYLIFFVNISRRFRLKKYTGSLPFMRWLDGICGTLYLAFATGLAFWKRA